MNLVIKVKRIRLESKMKWLTALINHQNNEDNHFLKQLPKPTNFHRYKKATLHLPRQQVNKLARICYSQWWSKVIKSVWTGLLTNTVCPILWKETISVSMETLQCYDTHPRKTVTYISVTSKRNKRKRCIHYSEEGCYFVQNVLNPNI